MAIRFVSSFLFFLILVPASIQSTSPTPDTGSNIDILEGTTRLNNNDDFETTKNPSTSIYNPFEDNDLTASNLHEAMNPITSVPNQEEKYKSSETLSSHQGSKTLPPFVTYNPHSNDPGISFPDDVENNDQIRKDSDSIETIVTEANKQPDSSENDKFTRQDADKQNEDEGINHPNIAPKIQLSSSDTISNYPSNRGQDISNNLDTTNDQSITVAKTDTNDQSMTVAKTDANEPLTTEPYTGANEPLTTEPYTGANEPLTTEPYTGANEPLTTEPYTGANEPLTTEAYTEEINSTVTDKTTTVFNSSTTNTTSDQVHDGSVLGLIDRFLEQKIAIILTAGICILVFAGIVTITTLFCFKNKKKSDHKYTPIVDEEPETALPLSPDDITTV